jgi:hypothetical protein
MELTRLPVKGEGFQAVIMVFTPMSRRLRDAKEGNGI